MGLKNSPDSLMWMGEVFWKENPSDEALKALDTRRGQSAKGLGQLLE
jgi:hypothetical protein